MGLAAVSIPVGVNCRIGSLEMSSKIRQKKEMVNCRIGSLESLGEIVERYQIVNCRIGSL